MIHEPLYIAPSRIQGKGLFTSKFLPKGYVVLDYRNRLKNWELMYCKDLTEYQINHNWLIMVGNDLCLTINEKSELHYLNHSREPNCNWFIEDLYIETARDVNEGEELLIDYRLEKRSNRESFPSWI